jgi:predicted transcriptional regulator
MADTITAQDLTLSAAEIVSAYVSNNSVKHSDLPQLIASVHSALKALNEPEAIPEEKPTPAVPVKKSITPEYLICLDDGKRFKSLKRHLGQLGMTPDQYRTKWGLPSDYPMVAPNYSASRAALAKSIGLGRKPAQEAPAPAPVAEEVAPEVAAPVAAPKKRGRKPASAQ